MNCKFFLSHPSLLRLETHLYFSNWLQFSNLTDNLIEEKTQEKNCNIIFRTRERKKYLFVSFYINILTVNITPSFTIFSHKNDFLERRTYFFSLKKC